MTDPKRAAALAASRFQDTLKDLRDCHDHLEDDIDPLSDEFEAREALIDLCSDIAVDWGVA